MSAHSDGGKGSDRRPGEGYQDGWDRIFGRAPRTGPPCYQDRDQGRNFPALDRSAHAAHAVHEVARADQVQVVQTPPKKGVCTCTCTRSVGVGGERVQNFVERGNA